MDTQHLKLTLADGRELTVQTANPDHIQWEIVAAREKYPTVLVRGDDVTVLAPRLMTTYLGWAAAVRTGQLDTKWTEFFTKECVGCELVETEPVDPTPPVPETG